MFLNEMGNAGEQIPGWAKDALSRLFWEWYRERQNDVILRFLWITVRFSHPKVREFVARIFGPETAA